MNYCSTYGFTQIHGATEGLFSAVENTMSAPPYSPHKARHSALWARTFTSRENHPPSPQAVKRGVTAAPSAEVCLLWLGVDLISALYAGSVFEQLQVLGLSPHSPSSWKSVVCHCKGTYRHISPFLLLNAPKPESLLVRSNTPSDPVTSRKWFMEYSSFKTAHLYQLNQTAFPSTIS